ncbi:MAG TPA: hypothetical protein VK638_19025 [Edaphobacter sp.]|nr:hypothetical protein [Edaphobacter sp.]
MATAPMSPMLVRTVIPLPQLNKQAGAPAVHAANPATKLGPRDSLTPLKIGQTPHASAIQRQVIINAVRPYVGTEVVNTFDYIRDGSAGGNHFVSDRLIRNIIGEVILNKNRDDAADLLSELWDNLNFVGVWSVSKTDTVLYDQSINRLISEISNQSSNRFACQGSGDGGGTRIDRPSTASARKAVSKFAEKLASGLSSIKSSLGGIGHAVMYELDEILAHNFDDEEAMRD